MLDLKNSKIISKVRLDDDHTDKIQAETSSAGRGGMTSKYEIGKKIAAKGIQVTIAHGKRENVILDLVAGKEIGTSFLID